MEYLKQLKLDAKEIKKLIEQIENIKLRQTLERVLERLENEITKIKLLRSF